ncbi:Receptor-type tyrosine-protein phosphatase delta, partial [Schistosoma japonicum]
LRIGGSKKFADDAGVIKRLEFPARSVSVTYAALHSGYTYTVSDLEPNSVYDVQLSAYYDLTLNMQSNWETTSCFTQMQRPPFVPTPIPVAVSPRRLQVMLQLSRVSEQYGKIRQYFLVVAPVHLADSTTEKISIDTTITASRGLPSSETRYVAARYLQDYFDPPPRHSRNFTLGSYNVKSNRPQRHVNSSRIRRQAMTSDDDFLYEADSEIMFDNKALVLGQEYKAFVRACVFQEDQSTADGPEACTSSAWSHGFGPDRQLPPWSEMMNKHLRDGELRSRNNLDASDNRNSNSLGFSLTRGFTGSGNDLFIIAIVAAIVSLALIAVICIAFGCIIRRKRRPKLMNHLTPNDSTMKQPLMRMNDCNPANGNSFPLITSGIEVMNSNLTSSVDKRGSSVVGNDSIQSGTLFAASSPGPPQSSLISSLSTTGRPNLITSATSSPLTGISHGNTMCDGLIIARNGLPGSESGPESAFDMQHLPFEMKGHSMHHPIPVNLLPDHVARLSAADNLLFSQEYESIETEQQFTWENSNLDVNKPKNRYANVIAYDHSRVVLQSIDCVPGSDYINANYIDGYRRMNAYIATQGPTPETFSDFWRMIWEQRVSIIVMMTKLEERSRIKCDQYWPSRGPESFASGLLLVKPIDTIELAYYTIRTFHLTARGIEDECREVKHFQFTGWPDHGVPEYPIPLLLFIRRVRATLASTTSNMFQSNHNVEQAPIVVHCSAGVGRTGAFIVIDIMLERLKYEKTVDIYGCVKALRKQRNFMVQTEDQYIFIHSALLEVIDAGNTEVPARNLSVHIKKLRMLDATGGSGMELEFKKLAQFRLPHAKYTSAQLGCNKNKNRLLNILPYESTRVPLQPIRGVEGSDYINANFIDSYRDRRAYIATQGPMAKTVEDFWRMIWELNSNIVVMLTNLNERGRECCYPYWPTERSSRYQYYVVDPMVEYNMPNYTLREFKLTDARDGQARTLRQFQFTEWPEHGVPESCEAFIDFLGQVHKTKEQFGQDVGRTGVFLALSIVLERMRHEGVVDMFQTIRMLRTQRPGMVQTEDQYQFCYNAVLEYLSSFDHYSV